MPTEYRVANKEIGSMLQQAMKRYCPKLTEYGVTVDLLWAWNSEDAPLKHGGYPAAALARICNYKQRVKGYGDCEIAIDKEDWDTKDDAERLALLHHELRHFEPVMGKNGLKRDALDRPKLRLRLHDAQIGVFYDVVEKHGAKAPESRLFADAYRKMVQLSFPFMDESPDSDDPDDASDDARELAAAEKG
jgi:hypothetical protein